MRESGGVSERQRGRRKREREEEGARARATSKITRYEGAEDVRPITHNKFEQQEKC